MSNFLGLSSYAWWTIAIITCSSVPCALLGCYLVLRRMSLLGDAISHAIRTVVGIEPELSTSGGTSDGRFIADICPQVVEIGPRNATIHKLNEYVEVKDLEQLPEIYRLTLEHLLLK